jgi:hypothetical protein
MTRQEAFGTLEAVWVVALSEGFCPGFSLKDCLAVIADWPRAELEAFIAEKMATRQKRREARRAAELKESAEG